MWGTLPKNIVGTQVELRAGTANAMTLATGTLERRRVSIGNVYYVVDGLHFRLSMVYATVGNRIYLGPAR